MSRSTRNVNEAAPTYTALYLLNLFGIPGAGDRNGKAEGGDPDRLGRGKTSASVVFDGAMGIGRVGPEERLGACLLLCGWGGSEHGSMTRSMPLTTR